jgi:hypothetical protein
MCIICRENPTNTIKSIISLGCSKVINLVECDTLIELPSIQGIKGLRGLSCARMSKLQTINPKQYSDGLKTLTFENCPELTHIPCFNAVESIQVINCPKLGSIQPMPNLKSIISFGCPNLVDTSNVTTHELPEFNNITRRHIQVYNAIYPKLTFALP